MSAAEERTEAIARELEPLASAWLAEVDAQPVEARPAALARLMADLVALSARSLLAEALGVPVAALKPDTKA